jgi:hypothetical protein
MPLNELIDSGNPIQPPPDVQRTTLGLDVLSRFICSTWDEAVNNGGKPFDAVVIGLVCSVDTARKRYSGLERHRISGFWY